MRRLHCDLIIHTGLIIQPKVRGRLPTRAERNQHRARDVVLGETNLFRAGSIDIHSQIRPVDELVNMNIDRARNLRDARLDLIRNLVPFRVAARHLNVNWRRNSEIQNLTNDVRGGEEEFGVGKIAVQFFAQDSHVLRDRFVLRI